MRVIGTSKNRRHNFPLLTSEIRVSRKLKSYTEIKSICHPFYGKKFGRYRNDTEKSLLTLKLTLFLNVMKHMISKSSFDLLIRNLRSYYLIGLCRKKLEIPLYTGAICHTRRLPLLP